jgi:hypothetical protein
MRAAQARSRDVAQRWHASDAYREGVAAFAGLDPHDVDGVAAAAERLLADAHWAGALLQPLADALRRDPWFEPPVRVHRDGLRTGAVLIDTPAASITAAVLSADALAAAPPPRTFVVSGRVAVTRYHRAGGATLRRWRTVPVGASFSAANAPPVEECTVRPLIDGDVLDHDGRTEAQLIDRPIRDVATLTTTVRGGAAPLMREYWIGDGTLVRTASLDDAGSRTRMLLTLLRLSGRHDAGEAFEAATRALAFDLRWAAMREWLALDVAAALPRLRDMADDPHPEVRAAARATLPHAEAACPA